ncbi:hypothetical protein ACSFA3_24520, partial [Variovorax sp. RHLX14]
WPRRCDLLLHSGARPAFAGGYTATRALAQDTLGSDGKRVPWAALAGQPVTAMAAIARPEAFFDMLRARGLTLASAPVRSETDKSWRAKPQATTDERLPAVFAIGR